MTLKFLAAASALALVTASWPAAAQHAGHQGMQMPMPMPKPAVKKAPPKKAAPKKPAAKSTGKKAVTAKAKAKPLPVNAPPVAADAQVMDHSKMDHGAMEGMPMPAPESPPASVPMDHSQMAHADPAMPMGDHAGHQAMSAALGPYPVGRESSGTAWQPDATGHSGLMGEVGGWTLMGHGVLNLVYDKQGGRRGDDKAFVSGMVMGMARRPVGNGMLQLRAGLSPDPLMGRRGYPLLLASGETADGQTRLIDRQHPHDFVMELSASLSQNIGKKSSLFLYAGLPGEPAFGPPAFMHREAIMDSPEAPISHHWLDSTHISFGVVTAGAVMDRVKVEVSRFNGREPDQHRWNIETGPLDSTAVRLSWNPTPELALQGSWGHFEDSEQLEPGVDQKRWSASALYARDIGGGAKLAGTLAWGRKTVEHHRYDAFAAEGSLKKGLWTAFLRGELAENSELLQVAHGPTYRVGKVSLGAIRDFAVADHVKLGVGALAALNFVPGGLSPLYGSRNPLGGMGFLRLKVD